MIRITADIDTRNPIIILKNIFTALILIDKIKKINIKLSNSKGIHLIIFTTKKYSKNKIFKIRKLIGDDIKRINMDKKRKYPKQYLFNKKIYLTNRI